MDLRTVSTLPNDPETVSQEEDSFTDSQKCSPKKKLVDAKHLAEVLLRDAGDVSETNVVSSNGGIRCPTCGISHPNPALSHAYRYCQYCKRVLREPRDLQLGLAEEAGTVVSLQLLIATYGHPVDASKAIDVTEKLRSLIEGTQPHTFLVLRATQDLRLLFGDPCPGSVKTLRVRYRMCGRRSEAKANEGLEGFLFRDLVIQVPHSQPKLVIYSATYGHPNGASNGRGIFDVTEFIQGLVDANGGEFLELDRTVNLDELFGNPCPGLQKVFNIEYEILGRSGEAKQYEAHGHLIEPIDIQATPTVAPLLIVLSATYGFTNDIIRDRVQVLKKQLYQVQLLQEKKDSGRAITLEQNQRIRTRPTLEKEMEMLLGAKTAFIDVRDKLQERVDSAGGHELSIPTDEDLNSWFGDPQPGVERTLKIDYHIRGLGGTGESSEMTKSGQQKNYVIQHKGSLVEKVSWNGQLLKPVRVVARKVLPILQVNHATYGHPNNHSKVFDVTDVACNIVQKLGGNRFLLSKEEDLQSLFMDPCKGVRKLLHVRYDVRGLSGLMRMEEKDGFLIGVVRLGYKPSQNAERDPQEPHKNLDQTCSSHESQVVH